MSFPIALSAAGTAIAGLGVNAPELLRKTPGPTSAGASEEALLQALDSYVTRTTNNPITDIDVATTAPSDISLKNLITDSDKLASYQTAAKGKNPGYVINPNSDRGLLAHEMGHIAFGQSNLGRRIQQFRQASPRMSRAIGTAALLTPALAAGLIPGDNDLGAAITAATVFSVPELIDEFEGTRRGLAVLKEANLPATMGQRARMAGGLLSYMARPIVIGASGQILGNSLRSMADDYVAGSQQTAGTLNG